MEESNTNNSDAGTNTQATGTDTSLSPTIDMQSTDTIMPSATIPAGSEFASRSARPHTTGGLYNRALRLNKKNYKKKKIKIIIIVSALAASALLLFVIIVVTKNNNDEIKCTDNASPETIINCIREGCDGECAERFTSAISETTEDPEEAIAIYQSLMDVANEYILTELLESRIHYILLNDPRGIYGEQALVDAYDLDAMGQDYRTAAMVISVSASYGYSDIANEYTEILYQRQIENGIYIDEEGIG